MTALGPRRGGGRSGTTWRGGARFRPRGSRPPPIPPSKFQGRRREGGSTENHLAKRPLLGFEAGGRSAGVVGSAMRLQTRAARVPVAVGAVAEGGSVDAVGVGMARTVGVARAGITANPLAKRKRIGPKVP